MLPQFDGEIIENDYSWAHRNGFSNWAMALLWILVAFFLFVLASNIIAFILLLIQALAGEGADGISTSLMDPDSMGMVFIGNTIGQILFLGGATWFVCLLQVSKTKRPAFLRLTKPKKIVMYVGIALALVITIQPIVLFMGWINSFLPVPETFKQLQAQSTELIQAYISGDSMLWLVLFHISVVPAICEEILFRGYALRSFEKSWGAIAAIIVSGIIFGSFHMQPGNILPLTMLGILFGYITWASQSILPAVGAHFLNNAGSTVLAKYYPEWAFAELTAEVLPSPLIIMGSMVISGYLVYLLYNNRAEPTPT